MNAGASPYVSGAVEGTAQWLRPSPRLLTLRRCEVLAVAVPVLATALVVPLLLAVPVLAVVFGLATVVVSLLTERFLRRRIRAWSYVERADDLLVRRGVLFSRLSVVPYGRMQFVDVVAGPFERLFALASVHMHTAAAASDARIPGLPVEEAARLRDQLAARGEARAAGL